MLLWGCARRFIYKLLLVFSIECWCVSVLFVSFIEWERERRTEREEERKKEGKQGGEREKREGVNIKTARQSEVTNATRRTNQFSVVVKDNLQDIFGSSE